MAWIPLHDTLPEHPKLRRLARSLGVDPMMAIAHLACLWLWALKYGKGGSLEAVDDIDVAEGAGWTGSPERFVGAMVEHGWIDRTDDGLKIHDWEEFGGRYEREKTRNADKMKRLRAREGNVAPKEPDSVPGTLPARNGNVAPKDSGHVTPKVLPARSAIREEESREEESVGVAPAHTRESFPPPGATATAYQIAVAQGLDGWQSDIFAKIADAHPCKTDIDRAATEFRKRIATMHDAGVALKHHAAWLADPAYSGRNRPLQWYFNDGTWRHPPAKPTDAAPSKPHLRDLVDLAVARKLSMTEFDKHAWGNAGPLEEQRAANPDAWRAASLEADRRIRERKAQGLDLLGALAWVG